jgi:Na+-translocating ferredoxin:NAD+ oxidoreductase RnfE subunit
MSSEAVVDVNRVNPDKGRIPRNIIVLGIVSLFTDALTEMMYPLIPIFVAALGSGAVILGVIEGVAETTAAILKLFSGIISEGAKGIHSVNVTVRKT